MASSDQSLSIALKSATNSLHEQAERHPLQRSLLKGELPLELFTQQMSQLLLVHTALESAILGVGANNASLASVSRQEQFQQPRLKQDLAHFGCDPASALPTPATKALCSKIEQFASSCPIALLGVLYVFEGSNNGGRYIARAVRSAYNIEGTQGISFLDPYGEAQPQKWAEFKTAMNALTLSDEDLDAVVAAACDTFCAITAMGDDLLSQASAQA